MSFHQHASTSGTSEVQLVISPTRPSRRCLSNASNDGDFQDVSYKKSKQINNQSGSTIRLQLSHHHNVTDTVNDHVNMNLNVNNHVTTTSSLISNNFTSGHNQQQQLLTTALARYALTHFPFPPHIVRFNSTNVSITHFKEEDESCTEDFISFRELQHERFSSSTFPGARSCIEIMLIRDDRFYLPILRLHKTTCVPCFEKSKPSDVVQNIAASIALTLCEELHFRHLYGKLICRRCREAVMKRMDPIKISNHQSAFQRLDALIWSDVESEESTGDTEFHYSPTSITPTSSIYSGPTL
ncbi:unnamed protein product [Adineta steineri]|uniref:Uncharacterized protein n=1 Tax=Adineta steineri TaxID=433720 RepID=A0A816BEM3_9BILA|nr:unnamed protein product [Adineta steineri]CAF1609838.1 unnamed protein product [Adineta steineri]